MKEIYQVLIIIKIFLLVFLLGLKTKGNINYEILLCNNYSPTKIQKGYLIPCYLNLFKSPYYYRYNNIYLTHYIIPYKDGNHFQVIIDSDLLKEENYDDISNIQKFSESINIEIDINSTNNTENIEKKTSSSGFSIGLIIAIIIPSAFV